MAGILGVVKLGAKALGNIPKLFKGAGTAAKATVATGAVGYAGWNFLENGKGVIDSGKEMILGPGGSDKLDRTLDNIGKTAENLSTAAENITGAMASGAEAVNNLVSGSNSSSSSEGVGEGQASDENIFSKIGNMFTGGTGGGIFDAVGNMVKGLFSGNLLKPVGLIAGLWMMFGRSGWMAKIGGALMMMMTLGLGGQSRGNQQSADNSQGRSQEQARAETESRGEEDNVSRSGGVHM